MRRPASNFAVTGVAGYIAPRHLAAICETGNRIVAAVDPHDAVGVLDRFSFDVRFFTDLDRFEGHLHTLGRGPERDRVHYVSICSPNDVHDAHVRLALRAGADAICEKPLVLDPRALDGLQTLEAETGGRVYTVAQLRVHPAVVALRTRLQEDAPTCRAVPLKYVTARGGWYQVGWKGSAVASGGSDNGPSVNIDEPDQPR